MRFVFYNPCDRMSGQRHSRRQHAGYPYPQTHRRGWQTMVQGGHAIFRNDRVDLREWRLPTTAARTRQRGFAHDSPRQPQASRCRAAHSAARRIGTVAEPSHHMVARPESEGASHARPTIRADGDELPAPAAFRNGNDSQGAHQARGEACRRLRWRCVCPVKDQGRARIDGSFVADKCLCCRQRASRTP